MTQSAGGGAARLWTDFARQRVKTHPVYVPQVYHVGLSRVGHIACVPSMRVTHTPLTDPKAARPLVHDVSPRAASAFDPESTLPAHHYVMGRQSSHPAMQMLGQGGGRVCSTAWLRPGMRAVGHAASRRLPAAALRPRCAALSPPPPPRRAARPAAPPQPTQFQRHPARSDSAASPLRGSQITPQAEEPLLQPRSAGPGVPRLPGSLSQQQRSR